MGPHVKDIIDKIMALLDREGVSFPWIFVAENVDVNGIKIFSSATNLDINAMPIGNTDIENIYRYISDIHHDVDN